MDVLLPRRSGRGLTAGLLAVVVMLAAWLAILMHRSTYDTWGALLIVPVEILISVPILVRAARREEDPRLLNIFILALAVKLAATLVRYFFIFNVYGGVADAVAYDKYGRDIAGRFHAGNLDTGLTTLTGTGFIRLLTGIIYFVMGPTRLGGFFIYSWMAFWGLFLWYRAFRIAVPEGSARAYAWLVFFLPSLLFWPSSIGKESFLILAVGVAAYGVAVAMSGRFARGSLILGTGLGLAALVRPHMALLLGIGATFGYALRRSRSGDPVAPVMKVIGVGVLIVLSAVFVSRAQSFFHIEDLSTESVIGVLESTQTRSSEGRSAFQGKVVRSPADLPQAVTTVLFRPFPNEAHNAQALVTAAESSMIGLLVLVRWRWLLAAVRSMRRRGYLAFAAAYLLAFCAAFASVGNFGILARQRVLALPALLALLCFPPARSRDDA